ncbi:MAG TPA: hypothetical protein VH590_12260 [Ktedonobacterales bacterium]
MSEVTGNAARSLSRARVTHPRRQMLERVGRLAGCIGSALAIVGFALPILSGPYQGDGYSVFLLLLVRGNWAQTYPPGGLEWTLVPLLVLLLAAVLAGPISLSLMAEPATRRFPRLSLGVFIIGGLLLGDVIGATFCLAAAVFGPVLFASLVLLSFRNALRGHPGMYALAPLVGLLAYGGGMALYLANGVHWRLGSDASAGGLALANLLGVGFWLCVSGWLLATLGGTLLWRLARGGTRR